jgi:hypothetical protein
MQLHGPADGLTNLRFWEYLKTNDHFCKYLKSKSDIDLNNFIACIYRQVKKITDPISYDGDNRIPFNENLVTNHAKLIASMDPTYKDGIIIFWKGSCSLLLKRFPEAFEGGEIKNTYGAYGIADAMAGAKFGRVDQVKEAWLYEVLISACNMEKLNRLNKK